MRVTYFASNPLLPVSGYHQCPALFKTSRNLKTQADTPSTSEGFLLGQRLRRAPPLCDNCAADFFFFVPLFQQSRHGTVACLTKCIVPQQYLQCDSAISGFGPMIQKCNVLKEEMPLQLFCIMHRMPLYFMFDIAITSAPNLIGRAAFPRALIFINCLKSL